MGLKLTEKDFQNDIMKYLKDVNGYVVRENKHYNKVEVLDIGVLEKFLKDTQQDKLDKISTNCDDVMIKFVKALNDEVNKRGMLDVIKNGLYIDGVRFLLLYLKEEKNNSEVEEQYNKNIVSVIEELVFSDEGRSDIVIFLNGIPVITFELKCESSNQSYADAIKQYKTTRKSHNLLFDFNKRALVHFAMDTSEAWMTTKLVGEATKFLPYNRGKSGHAGNVLIDGKHSTCYIWEDILQKDTLIYIIGKLMLVEVAKAKNNDREYKYSKRDTLIFPRYHQLDCLRKIVDQVKLSDECLNYLIQHSTGSGKTNTIAWLCYALTNVFRGSELFYDKILVLTDRKVVDRQLKRTIKSMSNSTSVACVEKSRRLGELMTDSTTRVIICTTQCMSYITRVLDKDDRRVGSVKNYAMVIDEAHQSTTGSYMSGVREGINRLADEEVEDGEKSPFDIIESKLNATGNPNNISVFAFTATPKQVTINTFGTKRKNGEVEPFHVYPMQQAIEEGFILDTLTNYKTYKINFSTTLKEKMKGLKTTRSQAMRAIAESLSTDDKNLEYKSKIIIDEFMKCTYNAVNGKAKAMVVSSSRLSAVKYKLIIDKILADRGITDVKTLVAFTNEVIKADKHVTKYLESGVKYTEKSMNNIGEVVIQNKFKDAEYRILIVADKFQTGFNEPLLHTMFIDKKLEGVNAVQTISRLNRTCTDKYDTYVVDFRNKYKDIRADFKKYAGVTCLDGELAYERLVACYDKTISCGLTTRDEVNEYVEELRKEDCNKIKLEHIGNVCRDRLKELDIDDIDIIFRQMKKYVGVYNYISATHKVTEEQLSLKLFCEGVHDKIALMMRDFKNNDALDLTGLIEHDNITISEDESVSKAKSVEISKKEEAKNSEARVLMQFGLSIEAKELPREEKQDIVDLLVEINQLTRAFYADGEIKDGGTYKGVEIDNDSMVDTIQEVLKATAHNEGFISLTESLYITNPKDRADEQCAGYVRNRMLGIMTGGKNKHLKNVKLFLSDGVFKPFANMIINKTRSKINK